MSVKKTLAGIASYVLVGAVALGIGGSLAFQNDETVSAENTWVVGDIEIEQLEYQRADGVSHINESAKEGDLVPFVQDKMIMPAVPFNNKSTDYSAETDSGRQFYWGDYTGGKGSNGLWDDSKLSNVMDKFVFVKNTGENDCYYRTVIAFECPEGATYGEAGDGADFMLNVNGNERFTWKENGYTEIDGTRYLLMTATYRDALIPGETSRPSLLQVVMTHHADNALVNSLGDEYEIKVVSQAVQLSGFEDAENTLTAAEMLNRAFGEVTAENNPWTAVPVADEAHLVEAIENGKNVTLTANINLGKNGVTVTEDTSINLNGFDIESEGDIFIVTDGATLTVEGEGTLTAGCGVTSNVVWANGGHAILKGGTYVGSYDEEAGGNDTIYTKNDGTVEIWGGTYSAYYSKMNQYNCLNENDDNRDTITVYGGTFKDFDPSNNLSEGKNTNFVADGYKVESKIDNDATWYTVVPN